MSTNKTQEYLRKHRWRLYVDDMPIDTTLNAKSFKATPDADDADQGYSSGTLEIEFYGTEKILKMLSDLDSKQVAIKIEITNGQAKVLSSALYIDCLLGRNWPASISLDYSSTDLVILSSQFEFESCEVL